MIKTSKTINSEDKLDRILQMLEAQKNERASGTDEDGFRVYNNKSLKALLGIGDKLLKHLRDNGYLAYVKHGDKFWYLHKDVVAFLERFRFKAFAEGDHIKGLEGGWT